MTVDVTFEKAKEPTRLTDLAVVVHLPHTRCDAREDAIRRVAQHCPVHETIATMSDVRLEIQDLADLVA